MNNHLPASLTASTERTASLFSLPIDMSSLDCIDPNLRCKVWQPCFFVLGFGPGGHRCCIICDSQESKQPVKAAVKREDKTKLILTVSSSRVCSNTSCRDLWRPCLASSLRCCLLTAPVKGLLCGHGHWRQEGSVTHTKSQTGSAHSCPTSPLWSPAFNSTALLGSAGLKENR